MIPYTSTPSSQLPVSNGSIAVFDVAADNIDAKTVESFGEEWSKFDSFSADEIEQVGNEYFDIVTPQMLHRETTVMDVGCGTGRWTKYVASKAKFVEAIDPSLAVLAADRLLADVANKRITKASVDYLPFPDNSFDFVFSLGVLHHIPNTAKAMQSCVAKLKPNGYFLVYLYYSLDNRGLLFKLIFHLSNLLRRVVSSMPAALKKIVCDILAIMVYMPLVIFGKVLLAMGMKTIAEKIPLHYYTDKSFNIIRNDALDRFGTPLEQRFSRAEITTMMEQCGLTDIIFSNRTPYWHAVGRKK